jgi:hypothetical protein
MTSILKVDTIQDTAGNNIINESGDTITIGASGDTVNVVGTLQNNGSALASYTDTDALDLFNASGSAPVYACRAWVNFNGTGTVAIRESGNVTSITDNGTGLYTVNFTTAISDVNYATIANAGPSLAAGNYAVAHYANSGTYSTSAVQISTVRQASGVPVLTDYSIISVSVLR